MTSNYFCYSALIGNDHLPPNVIDADPRIQFVLFSDTLSAAPKPWKLQKVDNYFCDPTITSGFLKANPEMLFDRDAKVVWVDGNLCDIKLDVGQIENLLSAAPIAAPHHASRDSVVLQSDLDDDISSIALIAEMTDAGFRHDSSLSDTCMLVRDLGDHRVRRADNLWWQAIISGACRDQISFDYALWSAGLVCASIEADRPEPNSFSRRPRPDSGSRQQRPSRRLSPNEVERRWSALNFPSLPDNYPKPSYFLERWTSKSLQVIRELNVAVIGSGEPLEGNYCYFHYYPISERSPPDPRRSWKREVLRTASRAGCKALEIGFNAGHSAAIMLDANPLLHLTSLDIGSHNYTEPCANLISSHFPGRFSFQAGRSNTLLAAINPTTARQFDVIHLDGGHDEKTVVGDLEWIVRNASAGCCIVVDDAYAKPIDRAIRNALEAGLMRPAILPIPSSGENRVFFKTDHGIARALTKSMRDLLSPFRLRR